MSNLAVQVDFSSDVLSSLDTNFFLLAAKENCG